MEKRVLAFDFGASSGRAVIGSFDGNKITLTEVHRFSNEPVKVGKTIYWDILRLFHEIKQGIIKAKLAGGFESIGIDTWGVDFGLVDKFGDLIENPIHYRDERNFGMIEEAEKIISKNELYNITGIQFMEFNTVFQLLSLLKNRPHILNNADKMLMLPDLFNYMLTGEMTTEYSIATTSQLTDLETKTWSYYLIDKFNFPKRLFTPVVKSGSVVGTLLNDIATELGVPKVKVIAVCSHDTQSAVTAVPSQDKDFAFISCGTWSLFGTELETPIISEESKAFNITNEGGFEGSIAFLKNICGLWLIQESRRQWIREGKEYSYAQLEELALKEKPFACFIDPDASDFVAMGNIPKRIQSFCERTGQYVPQTIGEIVRCIYESLALKYRYTFEGIKQATKKEYDKIHIVGGGTKDKLLCKMTADACNCEVVAGPIEATVLGNIAVQLLSDGTIKDLEQARKVIAKGENLLHYFPDRAKEFDESFEQFKSIIV